MVVAVSGGPDSTALLQALFWLRQDYQLELSVFHLNHQLRPEAAAEAEFVAGRAGQLGLPVAVVQADVRGYCRERRLSLQEGAREVRYQKLAAVREDIGADKAALGHTADDVAETMVMRLIKGTGLAGLAAIPPTRDGWIIRPLIETSRATIEAFLAEQGIAYVIDPSNRDERYFRNRVRLRVMPLLKQLNPDFIGSAGHTARILREENELVEAVAARHYTELVRVAEDEIQFPLEQLRALAPALRRRVLRLAVAAVKGDLRQIDFDHLERASAACESVAATELHLPGKVRVLTDGRHLVVCPKEVEGLGPAELASGETREIDRLTISVTIKERGRADVAGDRETVYLDAEKIHWPLTVRSVQPGDAFQPLGMVGHKKLQDFFVDAKIPKRRRPSIPVILDQEQIVAVGTLRIDERAKVAPSTRKVAVIKIKRRE